MLRIEGITAGYGPVTVLRNLTLDVGTAEIMCIMGRNGAGKSTLLNCIMGLVPARSGSITLHGTVLHTLSAHRVPCQGIAYVPQGRRLFGPLTVAENLEIGLMARGLGAETREKVLKLFPRLRERLGQIASTLSGGEQQMLAIGRALCLEPRILLLDEPTEGLQPSMIALIRDVVLQLREDGVATVLVEQRPDAVLRMADRIAFMAGGTVAEVTKARDLAADAPQFMQYVGV